MRVARACALASSCGRMCGHMRFDRNCCAHSGGVLRALLAELRRTPNAILGYWVDEAVVLNVRRLRVLCVCVCARGCASVARGA
eukprot:9396387-Pyramimonas_sp.AAC.1